MARLYIKTHWSSYNDATSVDFNSKKIHKDKMFGRQDILQFFSRVSKDHKYVKSPNMRQALFDHKSGPNISLYVIECFS